MMQAKLADGRTLQFPDGTDTQVIQTAVKNLLAQEPSSPKEIDTSLPKGPQSPGLEPSVMDLIRGSAEERTANLDRYFRSLDKDATTFENVKQAPLAVLSLAGQAVGAGTDAVSHIVGAIYKSTMPDTAKQFLKDTVLNLAETKVGKTGLAALSKGTAAYDKFAEKHPDAALHINSLFALSEVAAGGKVGELVSKAGLDSLKTIRHMDKVKNYTKYSRQITDDTFIGHISPPIAKARTWDKKEAYLKRANEATNLIVDNKNKITYFDGRKGLPQSFGDFSQAISQLKSDIYKRYSKSAKLAGDSGAKIQLIDVALELDDLAQNVGKPLEIRKYARKVQDELLDDLELTPSQAQTRIESLNEKLSTLTEYKTAGKKEVDAVVASHLRRLMGESIENSTGPGYAELRRKYGALSEVESEINKKFLQIARKTGGKTLTDHLTTHGAMYGALTMSPEVLVTSIGVKGADKFLRHISRPDASIKNMFTKMEKLNATNDKMLEKVSKYKGRQ